MINIIFKLYTVPFLIFFCLWPPYLDYRLGDAIGITPQRFLLILTPLVFLILVLCAHSRDLGYLFRQQKAIHALFLGYLLIRFISALTSKDPSYSLMLVIFEFISYYLLYCTTFLIINTQYKITQIVYISYVIMIVLAVIIAFEWVSENNIFKQFIGSRTSKIAEVALMENVRGEVYRAKGTFEHPLAMAQCLIFLFCVSFFYFRTKNSFISAFIKTLPGVIAIMFTGSRIGIVAVALIYYIGGSDVIERTRHFKIVIKMVILAGIISMVAFLAFFSSEESTSSTNTRLIQLILGWQYLTTHFLLGGGPGVANAELFDMQVDGLSIYRQTVDNYFLTLTLESGITGGLLFCGLLYLFWRRYRSLHSVGGIALLLCAVATFLVLSIYTVLPLLYFFLAFYSRCTIDQTRMPLKIFSNSISSR